jgi:hypothetical protein
MVSSGGLSIDGKVVESVGKRLSPAIALANHGELLAGAIAKPPGAAIATQDEIVSVIFDDVLDASGLAFNAYAGHLAPPGGLWV